MVKLDKRFEGVYQSIETLVEKVAQLLKDGQMVDQITIVTNKDKETILREFKIIVSLYKNDSILLEKIIWVIRHTASDDIFSLEKYGLTKIEERDQYNQAMAELNYVLLLGETTDHAYWYPKKRLGQPITDVEGNREFNQQSDFIDSGSANSDISIPRFNGTSTNQPWIDPDSDRNATRR
ncbi:general stress protein [Carnobacterium pleistocenium]|uniref:general stress protein n=1 Tax=Carnobacterium pleistocenium TaxID=181073 RepID=UPI001E5BE1E1|nr:general stress protein [Carnobacterium pleistocenium]